MKYEVHVTSKDQFGQDLVDHLLKLGALGAKQKEGTFSKLSFPFRVTLEVEADEPPMPSATVKVYDEKKKEIFATVLQAQAKKEEKKEEPKANFSVEQEESEDGEDSSDSEVDLSTNDDGQPWTKEQLDDLDWSMFKRIVKTQKITGRDRQKMTKQYLEAVKVSESQES